jgi:hypothetical protein
MKEEGKSLVPQLAEQERERPQQQAPISRPTQEQAGIHHTPSRCRKGR